MFPALLLVPTEISVLILVIIALLLFGGSRLAGVGKGAGRAIREFKEETQGLNDKDKKDDAAAKA
ncbi:MAG: twin-arginine translocase TatA/TatE family subunit, partial [Cutibacterium granulosum]|nr:twin-arginine translocase TatA/TatE family subunit [Cutibacterium granulosum]